MRDRMATEVIEVATKSEEDVIMQSSMKKERKGRISGKKNKFRCKVNKNGKRVIKLTETVVPPHFYF